MNPIYIIVLVLLLAPGLFLISVFNNLSKFKVRIREAWSQIDVQLKRRADLIPNLVEAVKGYATHEQEVFENVTKARSALLSASNVAETENATNMLTGALKSLFAVAEAYPELKASEGFVNLQKELSDTEDKVSYSRQFYNTVVRDYNQIIVMFPSNIVAGLFGFKSESFFEATTTEREAVKIKF